MEMVLLTTLQLAKRLCIAPITLQIWRSHQRLLLVVQGLKKLFADESFVNLLRVDKC